VNAGRPARRLRGALLAAIGVLFGLSIPWYRTGGEVAGSWLGLPDWVSVAILCYVGIAFLNSIAWLLTDVPDVPADTDEAGNSR
jgi:hypothetical protein